VPDVYIDFWHCNSTASAQLSPTAQETQSANSS
jgi:hypothetical protein